MSGASLLVACGPEVTHFSWPDTPSAAASIALVERAGDSEVLAFSAPEAPRIEIEEGDRVSVLSYALSLEELGLTAGRFEPNQQTTDCRWLLPDQVYQLAIIPADGSFSWTQRDDLPEPLRDIIALDWTRRCATCRGFRRLEVEADLGTQARVSVEGTVALPDGRALVLMTDYLGTNRIFLVDRQSARPLTGCGADVGPLGLIGEGTLVVGDYNFIRLGRLDLEALTCTVTATIALTDPPSNPRWVAGHRAGEAFELFVLDEAGKLHLIDDDGARVVGLAPPNVAEEIYQDGAVVRLEPGRAVASFSGQTLLHYDRGATRLERVEGLGTGRIYDIALDRAGRLLLGGEGRILRELDTGWSTVLISVADEVRRIHNYRDGLVTEVRKGHVIVIGPLTGGSCEPETGFIGSSSNPEMRYGFALDDAVFVPDGIEWEPETTAPGRRRLIWFEPKDDLPE